jgi:hypothetical protein
MTMSKDRTLSEIEFDILANFKKLGNLITNPTYWNSDSNGNTGNELNLEIPKTEALEDLQTIIELDFKRTLIDL